MLSSVAIAKNLANSGPLGGQISGAQTRPRMDSDAAMIERARIQRAQAGDTRTFRELFVKHRGDVTRIVFRMLGPSPDVEDVVQDVFLNVYRSLPSFRGDAKFSTWLYRLATNVTRMHLRRGRSRPKFADVEPPEAPRDQPPEPGPEVQLERAERIRALYRLLDQLTEKKRQVLVLHDLEGVSAKEIAETLSVPVLTVRTRLFYARKELYAALAAEPSLTGLMAQLMDHLPGRPKRERRSDSKPADKSKTASKTPGTTEVGSSERPAEGGDALAARGSVP